MTTMTIYRIIASAIDTQGARVAADTAEVLGDACGVTYASEAAAQRACDDLIDSVGDTGLTGVEYSLSPVTVLIEHPQVEIENDGEGHVSHVVSCVVRVDGRKYDTLWYARETHVKFGIDGLEPIGSADAWCDRTIHDDLGAACAVRIGREVLTSIAKVPTRRGLEAAL